MGSAKHKKLRGKKRAYDKFQTRAAHANLASERLSLLREFADGDRVVHGWVLRHKRIRWNRSPARKLPEDLVCFVCWRVPNCWHHVIQLQHGGTNHEWNRVPLCDDCHARVHPWLSKPKEQKSHDGAPTERGWMRRDAVATAPRVDIRPRLVKATGERIVAGHIIEKRDGV